MGAVPRNTLPLLALAGVVRSWRSTKGCAKAATAVALLVACGGPTSQRPAVEPSSPPEAEAATTQAGPEAVSPEAPPREDPGSPLCDEEGRCCLRGICLGEPWSPSEELSLLRVHRGVAVYAWDEPLGVELGAPMNDYLVSVAGARVLGLSLEFRGEEECADVGEALIRAWGEPRNRTSADWWEWRLGDADAELRVFRGARARTDRREPNVVHTSSRCVIQLFDRRYDDGTGEWSR